MENISTLFLSLWFRLISYCRFCFSSLFCSLPVKIEGETRGTNRSLEMSRFSMESIGPSLEVRHLIVLTRRAFSNKLETPPLTADTIHG